MSGKDWREIFRGKLAEEQIRALTEEQLTALEEHERLHEVYSRISRYGGAPRHIPTHLNDGSGSLSEGELLIAIEAIRNMAPSFFEVGVHKPVTIILTDGEEPDEKP